RPAPAPCAVPVVRQPRRFALVPWARRAAGAELPGLEHSRCGLVVRAPRSGALELPQPCAEALGHLGELLPTKEKEGDHRSGALQRALRPRSSQSRLDRPVATPPPSTGTTRGARSTGRFPSLPRGATRRFRPRASTGRSHGHSSPIPAMETSAPSGPQADAHGRADTGPVGRGTGAWRV